MYLRTPIDRPVSAQLSRLSFSTLHLHLAKESLKPKDQETTDDR